MSTGPLETKVKAATGGSAVGVAVAGLILWLLDEYAFTTGPVPDAFTVAVWTIVPIGLTFLGGYVARHTPRHDADTVAAERLAEVDELARRHDPLHPLPGQHRRDRGHRLGGAISSTPDLPAPDGPAPGAVDYPRRPEA